MTVVFQRSNRSEGSAGRAPSEGVRVRTLWTACVAHALHDGYTDLIYLLLPIWQSEFALGYGALALLRALAALTMAGLQVPAGRAAERFGGKNILALGTGLAALGYAFAGASSDLTTLCLSLIAIGCGLSVQHPIASGAVSRVFGEGARGPLGTYNFAGDLGKAGVPGAASLLLSFIPWHQMLWAMSAVGVAVAAGVATFLPPIAKPSLHATAVRRPKKQQRGFNILLTIGVLDTSVRMGFLTFLPFLLKAQHVSLSTIGLGLALVFVGGAGGKFACGWLAARFGILPTVLVTEVGTAALILLVLFLPVAPMLAVLPVLGVMLNGTSSVLYGTVPELAAGGRVERAFAVFYTGTIGAGAVAPIVFGFLGDATGPTIATVATAMTALLTLPLMTWLMRVSPAVSGQTDPPSTS
jgi:MFS transporter, FSR family, fosmidomycin resistance protein